MRKILQIILRWEARWILWKYKPRIVAVTGSVGKTSTKEAIFTVLQDSFRVRKSEGNLNTEIGVPLTIIGFPSGKGSYLRWLAIIFAGLRQVFFKIIYPEILVLEYGADRPGDIKYLVENFAPTIGVVTAIGKTPVHLEFYKDRQQLVAEKANLIKSLPATGVAVLNADDKDVAEMKFLTKGEAVTFGL